MSEHSYHEATFCSPQNTKTNILSYTILLTSCDNLVHSWCDGSSDRSFMVDPLSYFWFQPVIHDWGNKGCGMCYPVCGMMHIKEPSLRKSSACGSSGFPLLLSEWSYTMCLSPYNRKQNELSVSLNKTFPSFLPACNNLYKTF